MRIKFIAVLALIAAASGLSGCVVVPAHGYGYGYGPSVVVSPPPVVIGGGAYWGGGGRHWRRW